QLALQRVRCRAGQVPNGTRWRILKVDLAVHAVLRHRFDNYGAEPTPLRRRHGRPIALGPADGEGIAVGTPVDVDTTRSRRKRPVLSGIGGEFVDGEPDGLRASRLQQQLGAADENMRTNETRELREVGTNQILDVNSLPIVPDEEVVIR